MNFMRVVKAEPYPLEKVLQFYSLPNCIWRFIKTVQLIIIHIQANL